MQCKRTFVQRKRSLFSQYALKTVLRWTAFKQSTITLNVRVKPSDILEQSNEYSGWEYCLWIVYMRGFCIFFQEARRHFAELNGGSWADSYHSRRQSDRHYHRHCPSVPLAATSTLSFRGISFVSEYNLLRNLISNIIQSTFPMRQVNISWTQAMYLFAGKK